MDRTAQMANELEQMIERGEVDRDMKDEVTSVILDMRAGTHTLDQLYGASTPHKLLEILDEVNQRVKR